jgi:death on curing protein
MTGPDRIEPVWLDAEVALAIHDRQLAEHGGGIGVRDEGMLDSALTRPVNRWTYGEDDICALAAAYAFGVARNHPFVDGNKRTAWVLARLFLVLNGQTIKFDANDAINTVLALAAGELTEEELTDWFRLHLSGSPDV